MARELEPLHEAALEKCSVHTTIKVVLKTGNILRFASAEVLVNEGGEDELYPGKLKINDALRMTLTEATDRINLEIDNTELDLGQALISHPGAFEKSFAMVGAHFKNNSTNSEWHDEKIPGEITTAEVNGDVVPIYFLSELDAADYNGDLISEAFPDMERPAQPPSPTPNYDDLGGGGAPYPSELRRRLEPLLDDFQSGRHYLPDFYSY